MDEQLTFAALEKHFGRAEQRAWSEPVLRPMWAWLKMIRSVAGDLADRIRLRDEALYRQLMLLEEEVQGDRDKAAILERIGRAKGLLSACFFALVLHGVVVAAVTDGEPLRRPAGRLRVRREGVCV